MKKVLKNKTFFIMASIVLILCLIPIFSYAFILSSDLINSSVASTACFELSYTSSNDIALENTIPIPESEAAYLTPYTFTIKNICKLASSYDVTIEVLDNTTMDLNALRYKLDDSESQILGSINKNDSNVLKNANSSYTIKSGILLPNEEATYNLKMWIDEDATVAQAANKRFGSKVVVISSLNKNPYKLLSLNYNNDTKGVTSINVVDGRVAKDLPIPKRTGYIFNGWFDKDNNQVTESTQINEDKELIANWNKDNYELDIDPNGGTWNENIDTQTYNLEYEQTMKIDDPTRVGYTFVNWSLKGSGSSLKDKEFKMGYENAKLTANYVANVYQLTVNPNGGSYYGKTTSSIHNIAYNNSYMIPIPTRDGYTFTGWTLTGAGSTYNSQTFKMGYENASLTANWKPNTYLYITRHYKQNVNGGENYTLVESSTGSANYGSSIITDTKTYTGFTSPSRKAITIQIDSNPPTKNVIDYRYTRFKGTITINKNNGSASETITDVYYEQPKSITSPTRSCYTFSHWNVSGAGSYMSGQTLIMGYQNTTLSAVYSINSNTITFNAVGGSVSTSSTSAPCGSSITLPTPTRTGYIFEGWYDSANGGNKVGVAGSSYNVKDNKTLYAHWRVPKMTIRLWQYPNTASSAYTTTVKISNSSYSSLNGATSASLNNFWYEKNYQVNVLGKTQISITATNGATTKWYSDNSTSAYICTGATLRGTTPTADSSLFVVGDVGGADGAKRRVISSLTNLKCS